MSRFQRIGISLGLLGVAALTVWSLSALGRRSEGPVGALFAFVGERVQRAEWGAAQRLRGSGRAESLSTFQETRGDSERLRSPETPLLGAYDGTLPESLEGLLSLERELGTSFHLIHLFTGWGEGPEHRFPRRAAEAIWALGSVPLITWEPWLSGFEGTRERGLRPAEERDDGGLADVAAGRYDFYLTAWGEAAASFRRPIFVRFGHEMNDAYRYPWGPHHNDPDDYIAAFRHVVEVVRRAGGTNVLWIWSPHIAYEDFSAFYPGSDVVDWVGATVLNYGKVAYWSDWWTFDEIFTARYEGLAAFGKPIVLAELGTLMSGGDRSTWMTHALTDLPSRLPEVKAVVFFHERGDRSLTYQALDWTFDRDREVLNAVRDALTTWER